MSNDYKGRRYVCPPPLELERPFTSCALEPNHFVGWRSPRRLFSSDDKNLIARVVYSIHDRLPLRVGLEMIWLDFSDEAKSSKMCKSLLPVVSIKLGWAGGVDRHLTFFPSRQRCWLNEPFSSKLLCNNTTNFLICKRKQNIKTTPKRLIELIYSKMKT